MEVKVAACELDPGVAHESHDSTERAANVRLESAYNECRENCLRSKFCMAAVHG